MGKKSSLKSLQSLQLTSLSRPTTAGCVYKLIAPNKKSYIGISAKGVESRWKQHQYNANKGYGADDCNALYNAIRKYGSHKFVVEVLAEAKTWGELCQLEKQFIQQQKTWAPWGYNLTLGGEGALGRHPTALARKRMSEAQTRLLKDTAYRARKLKALKKAVKVRARNWWNRSEEERRAWSKKHGARVRAGHATPEAKARTIAAARKRAADPEIRRKLVAGQRGKKKVPWTIARKQAAAARRRQEWADPVMRQKRLLGFVRARNARGKQ